MSSSVIDYLIKSVKRKVKNININNSELPRFDCNKTLGTGTLFLLALTRYGK